MYYFNIMLTEKCNANCSHCYMGDYNHKLKTLTTKQINEIARKIPKETKKIVLTGGEIFLEKEILMYAIDKFKELNIEIELESNGKYFYSENTLKKLKEFNNKISAIRFSDDPFHEKGGINLEKVRDLKKYQQELNYEIKYLVQTKALKIGRAEKLSDKSIKKCNCMNNIKTEKNPYFFLDIEGNIYLCAWKLVPPIANIYKDEMSIVLERLKEPFNKKILIGKVEEAFSINNDKLKEYTNYSKINGQCMLCNKLFNVN